MVAIHTRIGGDDRDIRLGILIASAYAIEAEVEGEELFVAEDILHDDEVTDRLAGSLLLPLATRLT